MNIRYKRVLDTPDEDSDFWPSFTDMLTTILLVILLITAVSYIQLQETKEKIYKSQVEVEDIKGQLQEQKSIINQVIGVRGDIIEQLSTELEKADIAVRMNLQTGAIEFDNNLLFDTGSSVLKNEAKEQLKKFIPVYMTVLGNFEEDIEEIVIEGHTDNVGGYLFNLELSQQRAFNVVYYILSDAFGDFPNKEYFKKYVTANGKSFSQLIYTEKNGEQVIDLDASRRVVFKFRVNNAEEVKHKIEDAID